MKITDRRICSYIGNHVCPAKPEQAGKNGSCDGCTMFEKILSFKERSLALEAKSNNEKE